MVYIKKIFLIFLDVKFFITDTNGRPIENAELEQNELELNGTSDSNGKLILTNLCYGTMLNSFVISSAGFCDYTGSNYVINKIPQLLIPVELKANSGTYLPPPPMRAYSNWITKTYRNFKYLYLFKKQIYLS